MTVNINKVLIYLFSCIIFFPLLSCNQTKETEENRWEEFVELRRGNIPLMLIAPHGGDQKPQWINDRNCNGSVITQDQYTLGIALQIEQKLNQLGYQPYLVLAKIHRIKVDLNRSLATSHCEDDTSNPLWQLFHDQIYQFREELINDFGRGLVIDLHGHGHQIQRIELGYLLNGAQLRSLAQQGTDLLEGSTSIESLINQHPHHITLEEVIHGSRSLGTLLAENGFPSVPSSFDPAPAMDDPFFSGGTNTKVYGSKSAQHVDAIQLELNREGLRNDIVERERFATVFSRVIVDYLGIHYSDVFP